MRSHWTLACLFLLLGQSLSFAQVSVNFSASNTTGCGTVNAQFTDQSSSSNGSIVSWDWNFEGASSLVQNPGHFFTTPGSYTICLTVTDNEGEQGTLCKEDYIVVHSLPAPNFIVNPGTGCEPLTVEFQDNSTSGGNIETWTWGLGGTAGVVINTTGDDVSSTYALTGTYAVNLTVEDEFGCVNTVTNSTAVTVVSPPVVNVSANNVFSCNPPFQTTFVNNNIESGVTYNWDFGNGITFSGATPPPITYNQTGAYTITVTASAGLGCSVTETLDDYIEVGSPASFTYSPESGCADLAVSFQDTSPAPADSVWWSFGDGTTSTVFNPQHTYTQSGCFTVSYIRYSNQGCITAVNSQNCIQVFSKPTVTPIVDAPAGCELPHTVNFTANQAGLTEWLWDFGDGTTSTESNPSHDYNGTGTYPVSVTVTNLFGCSNTIQLEPIVVFEFASSLTASNLFGCTPLTVNLTSNNNSLVPIVDWQWTLSNNSTAPATVVTGVGENPSLVLVDTGLYNIELITINDLGCRDTVSYLNEAGVGMPPMIAFSADPDTACVNDGVSFLNASSSFANEWHWQFGDGGTSAEQNPEYQYEGIGPFDVTLEVIHHGCANELIEPEFIFINPPLAGFTPTTSCVDYFLLTVEDGSVGGTSMLYDFGVPGIDTDTSSVPNTQYLYPGAGTYSITQMVFNDTTGCADTLVHEVTLGIPVGTFSLSPTTGCVPLTVQVTDSSEFASQYSFELLDGLGTISDPTAAEPSILFDDPGLYSGVKLLITDLNGCQDSITLNDSIYVNAVTANYGIDPTAGCRPLLVAFSDSSSSVFGTVDQWQWNISDVANGSLNDQNPVFNFENIGSYDVSLTATDDWGCSNTFNINDAVYVTFPTADFSADTLGCTQSTVDFVSLSQGDGMTYDWDFGDGSGSVEQNPAHFYGAEGTYSVCLTVTDVNGCQHNTCKTDYVVIANPVALFTPDETYGACPPLLVNFENFSQNANTYNWDFGDNSGNSLQDNPAHIYTSPGIYTVTLIAASTFKCIDTLVLEDLIALEGPIGSFQFDEDSICLPSTVTFIAESIEAYNYYWDFGDGTIDTTLNVLNDTVSYAYKEAGRFVPKLILKDMAGCNIVMESPDTITTSIMEIDFVATDTALCEGELGTNFINLTTSSHPVYFKEWTFEGGDPATSAFDNVSVNYDTGGAFDVQFIANNGICFDTLFREDYIGIGFNPVADFSFTPGSGCVPLAIQFTDLSTVDSSNINQWNWNFVDMGTSDVQNPNETFLGGNSSLQQVELTVTSALGCTATSEAIIPLFPVPIATIDAIETLCKGEPAILNPQIQTDTSGMIYNWTGDPSLSCTDCLTPMIAPQDTTTFELVLTNSLGCSSSAFITVNVLPDTVPTIELTNDTSICYSHLAILQASGGDHLEAYQWDMSNPGLSCYESCFNPVATPDETTTYTLVVTNLNGCSSTDSVVIEVINQNEPIAGVDRVICEGDSIQLSLAFGNNPEWLITDDLTCSLCPDPIAFPEENMTYIVEAFTNEGCRIVDTVLVEVMREADIDAGETQIICGGEATTLNGQGLGTPTWSPSVNLSSANDWQPVATPVNSTDYILTVERGDCILSDSIFVEVTNQTVIWGEDSEICLGDTILLEVQGEADAIHWTSSEFLSDTDGEAIWATPEETTTFVATGVLATCAADTAEFTVYVNDNPQIRTDARRYYIPGQYVDLLVYATEENRNPLSYQWTPPIGLSCHTCTTPTVSPDSNMVYSVIATDSITGCVTERTVSIEALHACPEEIFGVPNVFSPNGDGSNDVFELRLSPTVESIVSFRVYDRWGGVVFETDDRFHGWDGTLKGKPMNNGVYIYVLEAVCPIDGSVIMKRGDVTLLR